MNHVEGKHSRQRSSCVLACLWGWQAASGGGWSKQGGIWERRGRGADEDGPFSCPWFSLSKMRSVAGFWAREWHNLTLTGSPQLLCWEYIEEGTEGRSRETRAVIQAQGAGGLERWHGSSGQFLLLCEREAGVVCRWQLLGKSQLCPWMARI